MGGGARCSKQRCDCCWRQCWHQCSDSSAHMHTTVGVCRSPNTPRGRHINPCIATKAQQFTRHAAKSAAVCKMCMQLHRDCMHGAHATAQRTHDKHERLHEERMHGTCNCAKGACMVYGGTTATLELPSARSLGHINRLGQEVGGHVGDQRHITHIRSALELDSLMNGRAGVRRQAFQGAESGRADDLLDA